MPASIYLNQIELQGFQVTSLILTESGGVPNWLPSRLRQLAGQVRAAVAVRLSAVGRAKSINPFNDGINALNLFKDITEWIVDAFPPTFRVSASSSVPASA